MLIESKSLNKKLVIAEMTTFWSLTLGRALAKLPAPEMRFFLGTSWRFLQGAGECLS